MLFGHQTDTNASTQPSVPTDMSVPPVTSNPLAVDPSTGSSFPATSSDNSPAPAMNTASTLFDNPLSDETTEAPAAENTSPPEIPAPEPLNQDQAPEPTTAPAPSGDSDDLLSLKQEALGQLAPLVDHLEQSPEEKFKTTMMMLQSTDNQALIKDAYAAAQAIPDEKAKAQALLDVVNEINYFTQKSQQ